MNIRVVTGLSVIEQFKKSKYFKINLGFALTEEKRQNERSFTNNDDFILRYKEHYHSVPYAKGNIGIIKFYGDLSYYDNKIVIFLDNDDYKYIFDFKQIQELGIDGYLGWMIKDANEKHEIITANREIIHEEPPVIVGDANKLKTNPAMVTWEDMVAYIKEKNIKT